MSDEQPISKVGYIFQVPINPDDPSDCPGPVKPLPPGSSWRSSAIIPEYASIACIFPDDVDVSTYWPNAENVTRISCTVPEMKTVRMHLLDEFGDFPPGSDD